MGSGSENILEINKTRSDLRGKTESEANVEQNEEDERRQFLPKLMIIRFVGEFVCVLQ